jgi:hypothetical protein
VRFISKGSNFSKAKETIKNTKGYVKIFAVSIILIIVAVFIMSLTIFLTQEGLPDEDYDLLIARLDATHVLLIQIGIGLFSLAIFLGAISNESLSTELRRGMVIAAGVGILALVIFNNITILIFS